MEILATVSENAALGLPELDLPLFFIESSAFADGQEMPLDFAAEGRNVSPQLEWSQIPPKTQSFAILCEDPDAVVNPPFVHWLLYGIPVTQTVLPEDLPPKDILSSGAMHGLNSLGELGYCGPRPPQGSGIHRYYFKIFALDENEGLNLKPGMTKDEFLDAIRSNILGEAELVGRYWHH